MDEKEVPMNIGKFKYSYDKNEYPIYFNCNSYRHIAKECRKLKKETIKCYKCDKVGHLSKNCRSEQKMKNRSVQEELDEEDSNKEEGFVKGSEYIWYNKPPYIINS